LRMSGVNKRGDRWSKHRSASKMSKRPCTWTTKPTSNLSEALPSTAPAQVEGGVYPRSCHRQVSPHHQPKPLSQQQYLVRLARSLRQLQRHAVGCLAANVSCFEAAWTSSCSKPASGRPTLLPIQKKCTAQHVSMSACQRPKRHQRIGFGWSVRVRHVVLCLVTFMRHHHVGASSKLN
jgi:hypothetical protein